MAAIIIPANIHAICVCATIHAIDINHAEQQHMVAMVQRPTIDHSPL